MCDKVIRFKNGGVEEVQTVMRRGLGVEEAESAIRILNGK